MSKTFTVKDVAEHKDEQNGMYIIVDSGVYDITSAYIYLDLFSALFRTTQLNILMVSTLHRFP